MQPIIVIPAKGYSRRLPNKNMRTCAGKPLVQWTIEAAIESKLGPVLVSTDCPQIKALASTFCDVVNEPTPAADSRTNLASVVLDAIAGRKGDTVIMLQPTSPLRGARHIVAAAEMFEQHNATTLASYVDVGKHQELLTTNGAIWMSARDFLFYSQTWRAANSHLVFRMSKSKSIDIDTPEDLNIAESLLLTEIHKSIH